MTVVLVLLAAAAVLLWPERRRGPVGRGPVGPGRRGPGAPHQANSGGRGANAPATGPRAPGRTGPGSVRPRDAPAPEDVADALVLVVLALRSGAALTQAVAVVAAASSGRVRRDLAAVVAALQWGVPVTEAWAYAGPAWRPAALAFQMAAGTGASPIGLLLDAGARIRDEREQDQARRAARAGVLLVLPLGLGFLPAFACTAVIPVVLALAGSVLAS